MKKSYILKGNICYTKIPDQIETVESGYLVCVEGLCKGVYREIPEAFTGFELKDYEDRLILPGMVDLHIHAPQYSFRGLGMDLELLDWLKQRAFVEENRYIDLTYAKKAYEIFVEDLKRSSTTRACIFATIHREATELLMELMEDTGLITLIGKVSMDRNSPENLKENSKDAIKELRTWLKDIQGKYVRTKPILTPRFLPSCSEGLMKELGRIGHAYSLPVQSHLSENPEEIEWVKKLCPWSAFYGDAYDHFGLFGKELRTVMAHCVWSTEEEIQRIRENGVFIAHCPESNSNLASGIAPIRKYLNQGIHVGLGSDIAGGSTISLFRAMAQAIQVSKLYWRFQDSSLKPLNASEAFYLATKGGGAFFGKVGSFEEGYEMDAVVLEDKDQKHAQDLNLKERLERMIYLVEEKENVAAKYVAGKQIF